MKVAKIDVRSKLSIHVTSAVNYMDNLVISIRLRVTNFSKMTTTAVASNRPLVSSNDFQEGFSGKCFSKKSNDWWQGFCIQRGFTVHMVQARHV